MSRKTFRRRCTGRKAVTCMIIIIYHAQPKIIQNIKEIERNSKSRSDQYVHCVMHKCIMVKVGGKLETQKVFKKHAKIRGKFAKVEGK